LPTPQSPEAERLAAQLSKPGKWHFRRKQRLDPNQSEFRSLADWLSFLRSDEGVRNAGGSISSYAVLEEIDGVDLMEEVREMVELFRPLMERVIADAPPAAANQQGRQAATTPVAPLTLSAFGDLLQVFLRELAEARSGPFEKTDALWNAMAAVKRRLEQFPAVHRRPNLLVDISVGQGNWADVPWIALLNTKVTTSTQEGIYVVFLITAGLITFFSR
jgi:MrcB-like, N-terminal domain